MLPQGSTQTMAHSREWNSILYKHFQHESTKLYQAEKCAHLSKLPGQRKSDEQWDHLICQKFQIEKHKLKKKIFANTSFSVNVRYCGKITIGYLYILIK